MNNYIICFYQAGQAYVGEPEEKKEFVAGELLMVTEKEMFRWIEIAKFDTVKLVIYKVWTVCDLS